jgi:hypothetical protein
MKKLIISIISLSILVSCSDKEIATPSVLVKPITGPEVYYAEILHKQVYRIGDTLRITYNQMPKHEYAFPHPNYIKFVSVVLISNK